MFIGRQQELADLDDLYRRGTGGVAVIYGRRRVGKSTLIKQFLESKRNAFYFEGIEEENTPDQIAHFAQTLHNQLGSPMTDDVRFTSWNAVLSYFTKLAITKPRTVIVFDELQWMAVKRAKLVSLIKYYWDNHWKDKKVVLILCGSIASFMVKQVINSKAMYGRVSLEIKLEKLLPYHAAQLLPRCPDREVIHYLLTLGGVPKYLEEVSPNRSFEHNINRLCFRQHGLMENEFQRIFYSQFPETSSYIKIVRALSTEAMTFEKLAKTTGIASGGGLRNYLRNLEDAEFIETRIPYGKAEASKLKRYMIGDEFISFYFKYIAPHGELIKNNRDRNLFSKLVKPVWNPWLGYAFERYCFHYSQVLAKIMGFDEEVKRSSVVMNSERLGFQVDLIYERFDNVVVVTEIKFHDKEISTAIIPEVNKKIEALAVPRNTRVERALISCHGPSKGLLNSRFFDYSVNLSELLHYR